VAAAGGDEEGQAALKAALAIAAPLGLTAVAVGVERESQLAWLRREGCALAQGPLLGRSAAADALAPLLEAEKQPQ